MVAVSDEEAHHARNVLRLAVGDAVRLVDGAGLAAEAEVVAVERHRLVCRAEEPQPIPDPAASQLTVILAPPKGDRLADVVRGLTELGVGAIGWLACERGERLPGNQERLDRIACEALKQCRRGRLPAFVGTHAMATLAKPGVRCILLDRAGGRAEPGNVAATTLVIGPEGGLTTEEVSALTAAGAITVRLCAPVLRIETAALAAAAVWAAAWEGL